MDREFGEVGAVVHGVLQPSPFWQIEPRAVSATFGPTSVPSRSLSGYHALIGASS